MLAFAHIPTGTTANKGLILMMRKAEALHQPLAPTAIGADIEIGRATP